MSNTCNRSAATVVLLTAIVGLSLAGCQVGSSTPTPSPTVATNAEPTATPVPRLNAQDPLDPGRYQVNAGIPTTVTVAVPAGWSAGGDWVVIGPRDNDMPDGMAIRFYWIDNLAANPAVPAEGNLDPAVGPSVDDLVQAVVAHPAWEATEPTDITIDGHEGQLVEFAIPMDAELTADGQFFLSVDPGGGGIWGFALGQIFEWYIVDVDGRRLIIDSFHYPDTPEEDLAAQRAVVESIQFEP